MASKEQRLAFIAWSEWLRHLVAINWFSLYGAQDFMFMGWENNLHIVLEAAFWSIDFHFMLYRISCLWIGEITWTLFLDLIDIGRSSHSGCVCIFCKKSIEKTNLNQCWDTGKMFIWILNGFVECENLRNVLESQILSNSILTFSTTIHIIKIYEPLIFIFENFSSTHFLY
jgi:hypothetical protein